MYLEKIINNLEQKQEFNQKTKSLGSLACEEYQTELFFSSQLDDIEEAKSVCASCDFALECFQAAVERNEYAGVWGGYLFEEGYIVHSKRRRGRPRKDEVFVEPIKVEEFLYVNS